MKIQFVFRILKWEYLSSFIVVFFQNNYSSSETLRWSTYTYQDRSADVHYAVPHLLNLSGSLARAFDRFRCNSVFVLVLMGRIL